MTVNVPRDIFKGAEAEPVPGKVKDFTELMMSRYPWIKPGSMDVLMKNARREMLRILDEETGGRNESVRKEAQGDLEGAIRHLKKHLGEDPGDADSWYALGKLLCKAGRSKEGYEAFNKGRSLF